MYFKKVNFVIFELLLHLKNQKRGLKKMKFGSDGFETDEHLVKFLVWGKATKRCNWEKLLTKRWFHQRRLRKNFLITRDGTQGD